MKSRMSEQTSKIMSRIRCKGTGLEKALMKELWRRGLRYRKNVSKIFGKPDIVFIKAKVLIFCDSEFWHGFDWEKRKPTLKTNREYWVNKIERNMRRDREVNRKLVQDGWIVMRFWGEDIKKHLKECADTVEYVVKYSNEEPEERIYWP